LCFPDGIYFSVPGIVKLWESPRQSRGFTPINYQNSLSFSEKTRIILALLGIIPFLLVIYLFFYGKIDIADMIRLFSALALFSILTGFSLLSALHRTGVRDKTPTL